MRTHLLPQSSANPAMVQEYGDDLPSSRQARVAMAVLVLDAVGTLGMSAFQSRPPRYRRHRLSDSTC
jgi:hypothetical protein